MVKTSSGKTGMRSFEVVAALKYGTGVTKSKPGRYLSRNPVGAAKKAFNRLCRVKKIVGRCNMTVTVKEVTRGSKGKEYHYKLLRKKLTVPRVVQRGNVEYVIEYEVKATSVNNPKKTGQIKNNSKFKTRRSRGRMSKKTKKKKRLSPNNVRRLF